jgi:hypothetical protein
VVTITRSSPFESMVASEREDDSVRIELRSLKIHGRFDLRVPLARWTLP